MQHYDVIIVGAGIIGASTAMQLQQAYPAKRILILEKESAPAMHQTGRNSGVIHAGVYYEPGSLKARYCKAGLRATIDFCKSNRLPFRQCGKLIVATDDHEMLRLEALYARTQANHLTTKLVSASTLHKLEPHIAGKGAIKVAETGIVDYATVTRTMCDIFTRLGGAIAYDSQVKMLDEHASHIELRTHGGNFTCGVLINCSGLYCDQIAAMLGLQPDFKIVPFRGEYYRLPARYNELVKHLIYPVPDPQLPFLGVHLTRMIDGSLTVGPNAVMAFAREGYNRRDICFADVLETLGYKGFWKLLRRHYKSGLGEVKSSLAKSHYLSLVQKYCPQIQSDDLLPHPSGVRAQAVSNDGELIHDFKFLETPRSLHVGNAPSPAATSAIPIGQQIVAQAADKLS